MPPVRPQRSCSSRNGPWVAWCRWPAAAAAGPVPSAATCWAARPGSWASRPWGFVMIYHDIHLIYT